MKEKTNISNQNNTNQNNSTMAMAIAQTNEDFKNALLVVSVLTNLFVLTTWLVINVSSQYGESMLAYLAK